MCSSRVALLVAVGAWCASCASCAGCAAASRRTQAGGGYAVRENWDAPSRGPIHARVVIQAFSEFECPYCARAEATIEDVLARYPNDVRMVWRDYPLDAHPHAMLAAEAAREVFSQQGNDGFWNYHRVLFAHQTELRRSDLEHYATDAGLDMTRFRAALDGHAHVRAIRADIAAANATGASMGAPAFFINGELVPGAMPFADFAHAIESHLTP